MPRNRAPAKPVEATIDEQGALHCGRCHQAFPHVFNARIAEHVIARDSDGFETLKVAPGVEMRVHYGAVAEEWLDVMSIVAWGWRFDGTTWRPTSKSRADWLWASKVLKHPESHSDADVARARKGQERGSFHRADHDPSLSTQDRHAVDIARRFTLPTQIECINCGRLNRVVRPD